MLVNIVPRTEYLQPISDLPPTTTARYRDLREYLTHPARFSRVLVLPITGSSNKLEDLEGDTGHSPLLMTSQPRTLSSKSNHRRRE
jgi:hypothetical protein